MSEFEQGEFYYQGRVDGTCPYCHGLNGEVTGWDCIDRMEVYSECPDCGGKWTDVFLYSGFIADRVPEGDGE